jgi:hypothetical protein
MNTALVWTGGEIIEDVVVELTDQPISLTGRILNVGDDMLPASVLAFPRDPATWDEPGIQPDRIRTAAVKLNGQYVLTELPAGRYYLAAIQGGLPVDWASSGFFKLLAASAEERDIDWGDDVVVDLTARKVR